MTTGDATTIGSQLAMGHGVSDAMTMMQPELAALNLALTTGVAMLAVLVQLGAGLAPFGATTAPFGAVSQGSHQTGMEQPTPNMSDQARLGTISVPTQSAEIRRPTSGTVFAPAAARQAEPRAAVTSSPHRTRQQTRTIDRQRSVRAASAAAESTPVTQISPEAGDPISAPSPTSRIFLAPAFAPAAPSFDPAAATLAPAIAALAPAVAQTSTSPTPTHQAFATASIKSPDTSNSLGMPTQAPIEYCLSNASISPISSPPISSTPAMRPPTQQDAAPPNMTPLLTSIAPHLPQEAASQDPVMLSTSFAPRARSTSPLLHPESSDRTQDGRGDSPNGFEPRQGTMLIDGTQLGRWVIDYLERQASRPIAGTTGIDPRLSATFPGAPNGS